MIFDQHTKSLLVELLSPQLSCKSSVDLFYLTPFLARSILYRYINKDFGSNEICCWYHTGMLFYSAHSSIIT